MDLGNNADINDSGRRISWLDPGKLLFLTTVIFLALGCSPDRASNSANTANATKNTVSNSPANIGNTANANIVNAATSEKKDGEHHEHTAPHGGTLVVFGEEFAHVELVLDPASGKLSLYALDGEAEKPIRLKEGELEIQIKKPSAFTLKLKAVENSLTGEKTGDTSEFSVTSDQLKNLKEFDAVLAGINIKGKSFKNTEFNFPKGNEEAHHEEAGHEKGGKDDKH
jgi:streptogramin lyase